MGGGGGRQKSSVTTDDGGICVLCVCGFFIFWAPRRRLSLPAREHLTLGGTNDRQIFFTYDIIIFRIRSVPLRLCQRWKEKWVGRTEMELAGNGKCLSLTRHHTMYNNQCNEGQVFNKSTYYCLSVTQYFGRVTSPQSVWLPTSPGAATLDGR
jgi:hypothetical protein